MSCIHAFAMFCNLDIGDLHVSDMPEFMEYK